MTLDFDPEEVQMSDHYATADDGTQIQMRWYTKEGATPGPAVVYFHGGGYFFGHIEHFDGTVARYVSASGVPMLSVEYRRAPEHPFPTPVEDGYAALNWLHEHAVELFRDEDTAYATKLSRAGVPVEFHLHPGVPHEFDSIAFNSNVARRAIADRIRVLKSI